MPSATLTTPPFLTPAVPSRRTHHRFTVDDYEQMIKVGVLGENDRVELIDGEIIEKMSIGELHASCVKRLNDRLTRLLLDRVCIGVQDPIRLVNSIPEPDLSLLKPKADYYSSGHPGPDDVLLLIEVADSSVEFDQEDKQKIYAEAGIADFWIVNLVERQLEVYRQPQATAYAEVQILRDHQTISPFAFADVTLTVQDLFPPTAT